MNPQSKPWWTSAIVYYFLGLLGVLFWLAVGAGLLSRFGGISFAPSNYGRLVIAFIFFYAICGLLQNTANKTAMKWFRHARHEAKSETDRSIEDRLDELERLKRRAMVTSEEYEAKRKDILNDL